MSEWLELLKIAWLRNASIIAKVQKIMSGDKGSRGSLCGDVVNCVLANLRYR